MPSADGGEPGAGSPPSAAGSEIEYRVNPPVTNGELDALYLASWPNHQPPYDFGPELERALAYACAYYGDELIGFVRLAWDGSVHTFLLEPTVRPNFRRRGIGRTLVARVVAVARERGMEWVHVDYDPELGDFYRACGFQPTDAGLINLRTTPTAVPDVHGR